MEQLERELRDFVVETFLLGRDEAMPDRTASLVAACVVDGTGVMELVAFLERRYGIHVLTDEIVPENLDSLERIATFVRLKTTERGTGERRSRVAGD